MNAMVEFEPRARRVALPARGGEMAVLDFGPADRPVDVVFSQNVTYGNRPSNSSAGAGLGFQYAPDYVWFLFNHVYDSDYGIATGSDSDLGTGTESFFIGNLIHDIHDSDRDFKPLTAWHNCGISLPGGVNRYVVNNTLVNVANVGAGIAGGTNISIDDNRIYQHKDQAPYVNLGLMVWGQAGAACTGGHTVRRNRVWTLNSLGAQNSYWNAGNCADVQQEGNVFADRSLTPDIFDEVPAACD